jgi:DNA-directed RNA polymerase subunit RPC12/RpoP
MRQHHEGNFWLWRERLLEISKEAPASYVCAKCRIHPRLEQDTRGFALALDVRCPYCHIQNADDKFDHPADDKQTKKPARILE